VYDKSSQSVAMKGKAPDASLKSPHVEALKAKLKDEKHPVTTLKAAVSVWTAQEAPEGGAAEQGDTQ
ncbi:hypothetical protein A2U01_0038487, partial [Trifolium medium]|nr:hypothetical protein [Trifolium medium]